jgi:pimeloyl-ACP methyl ester carboxylesterase
MNDTPSRTIVFSHANSFPASTYTRLFDAWGAAGYTVHAIDKYGHDPRYPVTPDWPHLVQQLHDFIVAKCGAPVHLVGHSLGGYLSMMVACRHPALARSVVVMDSPLLFGWKRAGLALAKRLGHMGRVMPPSRIAAQRTQEWPSLQAVQAHFGSKPKFAAFHPSVLGHYIHGGTEAQDNGTARRLSFRREIETAIYNGLPQGLLGELRQHPLRCPIAYIGGTRSMEGRAVGLKGTQEIVGPNLSWIEGSHLYPFEHPQQTAHEVLRWLTQFAPPGASPT